MLLTKCYRPLLVVLAFATTQSAQAEEFCASTDEVQRIESFYAEKPGAQPVIVAKRLDLPAAVVASGLPADQAVSAPADAFADVWSAMSAWTQATFLIMKGNSVFEILSGVGPGSPSTRSQYYNIAYEHPLRGHLRPDEFASVYAVDLPSGGDRPVRGVLVFDAEGAQVFGAFISGESMEPLPGDDEKFAQVWQLIADRPSVCSMSR